MGQLSLLILLLAALMTPLLMARFKITFLPTAVVEIIVGIVLGTSGFNWIHTSSTLNQLSTLGVIILLFLSGMEIDFSLFRRHPLPQTARAKKAAANSPRQLGPLMLAILAYGTVVILAIAMGWTLKTTGLFTDPWLAAILFATIALGVVIATLKENELLSRPYGQTLLLIAVLGEVVPMLSLTVYASLVGHASKSIYWVLILFIVAAILQLRFRTFFTWFERINKSTTQLDIRLAFFLIVALVTVAETVGAENILGAFVAGIVMKLLEPRPATQEKLDSIGYGFFIPIFFIMTGVKLDIPALMASPQTLLLIPLLFIGYVVAKLAIWPILKLRFKAVNATAGTALSVTTITLVLAIDSVAVSLHQMTNQQAGAFLLAAIITCIFAPLLFNRLFAADAEPLPKQTVHFIGTNITTVPVAQQLAKGWYDIAMFTDKPENYRAYNSEVNVTLVDPFTPKRLADIGAFDADILFIGHYNAAQNAGVALAAKEYGVPRVLVRYEDRNILDQTEDQLTAAGVEVFNTGEITLALSRSLIEAPDTLRILTDTDAGIFEVTILNQRFTGINLSDLPFINQITISQVIRNRQFIKPTGNLVLQLNDRLIFTGSKAAIADIRAALGTVNH
ncbi:monovalent cation:proton antiporter family protein [Furfurilactobacillus curtus]|uniref:Potassium transporter n=1 Tax=Furfurilactobacillus curtus TaxID=1746200 RepID=A0ABQ5JRR8_9LACO